MQSIVDTFYYYCKQGALKKAQRLMILNSCELTENSVNLGFVYACIHGHRAFVAWMLHRNPLLDLSWKDNLAFRLSLEKGQLEIAQYLVMKHPTMDVKADRDRIFYNICKNGHIECAKWYASLQDQTFSILGNQFDSFNIVCSHGYEEMIVWMIQVSGCSLSTFHAERTDTLEQHGLPLMNHPLSWLFMCNYGKLLKNICLQFPQWHYDLLRDQMLVSTLMYYSYTSMNYEMFEWLTYLNVIQNKQPPSYIQMAFVLASSTNDTHFLRLMCNVFDFTVDNCLEAIIKAANNGHLSIIKYLYKKFKLQNVCEALLNKCVPLWIVAAIKEGHVSVVHWILKTYPLFEQTLKWDTLFTILCGYNSYETIRFLHRKFSNHISTSQYQQGFVNACLNYQLLTAKWLLQITPSIDVTVNHHHIIRTIDTDNTDCHEIIKWLVSLYPDVYEIIVDENQNWIVKINLRMNVIPEIELRDEMCVICYEQATVQTNCRHCHCETCVKKAYELSPLCSFCRIPVTHVQFIVEK